jgi:hypothetical protein
MADRRNTKTAPAGPNKPKSFVKLDDDLIDSEAWLHLSPPAFKLLVAVWRRHRGPANNGCIPFSIRDARKLLGCGPNQARKYFEELERKGFLRLTRESSFNVKTKLAREWEITAEPVGDSTPAADFKDWKPE